MPHIGSADNLRIRHDSEIGDPDASDGLRLYPPARYYEMDEAFQAAMIAAGYRPATRISTSTFDHLPKRIQANSVVASASPIANF